jgi:hypothetical protein
MAQGGASLARRNSNFGWRSPVGRSGVAPAGISARNNGALLLHNLVMHAAAGIGLRDG